MDISEIKKAYTFKTEPEWHQVGGAEFLIAPNIKGLSERWGKLTKPYSRNQGGEVKTSIPQEKEAELNAQTMVGTIVLDWRGMTKNGKPLKFSESKAVGLFTEVPGLLFDVFKIAKEMSETPAEA